MQFYFNLRLAALAALALTNAAVRGHNQFASQDPRVRPYGGIGRRASFRI
jgi:hypothetical protein